MLLSFFFCCFLTFFSSPGARLCSGLLRLVPPPGAKPRRRRTAVTRSIPGFFCVTGQKKKCLVYQRAALEQRHVCRNRTNWSHIYANALNQIFFFFKAAQKCGYHFGTCAFTHAHRGRFQLYKRGFWPNDATLLIPVPLK